MLIPWSTRTKLVGLMARIGVLKRDCLLNKPPKKIQKPKLKPEKSCVDDIYLS